MSKIDKPRKIPQQTAEIKRWECSISDCIYTNQSIRKLKANLQ